MRKSTALSWIEHAEAARVLIDVDFEQAPKPVERRPPVAAWATAAIEALAGWCAGLGDWLTRPHSDGWAALQLQPIRIRSAHRRPVSDDQNFGCHW
jgi:hypothetical protein